MILYPLLRNLNIQKWSSFPCLDQRRKTCVFPLLTSVSILFVFIQHIFANNFYFFLPHPDKFPKFIQYILAKMSLQFPRIKRTIIASGPEYPFLCETDHRGDKIKTTPNDIKAMDSAFDHFSDVILRKWKFDESTSDPTSLITTINESFPQNPKQARVINSCQSSMQWQILKCAAFAFFFSTKLAYSYKEPKMPDLPTEDLIVKLKGYHDLKAEILAQMSAFIKVGLDVINAKRKEFGLNVMTLPPSAKEKWPPTDLENPCRWQNAVHDPAQNPGKGIVVSWDAKLCKTRNSEDSTGVVGGQPIIAKKKNDTKIFLHHFLNSMPFVHFHPEKVISSELARHYYDAMNIKPGKYPLWKNKSQDFCDYHDDAVNGRENVDDKFMVSLFPPKPDAKK